MADAPNNSRNDSRKQVRFIHTSDWQLGMTRAFFSDEAASRFSQARIDAITQLGQLAQAQGAQFVVVAGDVFESNHLSRQILLRTLDALAALPVPVFLLPGNHDPLDAASIFLTPELLAAPEHIIVLRDMQPVAVPGVPGVEVVGAPWRTKHPNGDLCAQLAAQLAPAAGVIRIAVAHGQVDLLSPDMSRPEIIASAEVEQALLAEKFHYLALGDRHSVYSVGASGRIWYSGAPVATAFVEEKPNHVLLVDLDGNQSCEVQPLLVGNWQFIAEHRLLNDAQDLEDFRQWLEALPNKQCLAIKVSFTGSINLALAAELEELMEGQQTRFASLRTRERLTDLAVVPDQLDEDSVVLAGYAKSAWDELLQEASAGDAIARDALLLFYRLAGRDV